MKIVKNEYIVLLYDEKDIEYVNKSNENFIKKGFILYTEGKHDEYDFYREYKKINHNQHEN